MKTLTNQVNNGFMFYHLKSCNLSLKIWVLDEEMIEQNIIECGLI